MSEVVVQVKVCGICGTDYKAIKGIRTNVTFPFIPGHEIASIVAALGPGVSHVKEGDGIICQLSGLCCVCKHCRAGNTICGDETKFKLKRNVTGYVWVFSGPEVVIYRFSKSRDGTVLNEVVKDFNGVLVSDYYSVYDSAPCPQQKCLVHLVRDINDDLLKAPFNEELKEFATRFTALMAPIIETIDRYGPTKRHLRKFVIDAERFKKWVAGQQFTSKVMSIYQTLRRKEGSFLRFLLSGKTDLFEFLGE